MLWKAMSVKVKFVRAIEREVKVGERKPTREKMVAEKYMSEFYKYLLGLTAWNIPRLL